MATLSEPDPRLVTCPDRSWYTDPAVLDAERRQIFARRWVLIGRAAQLDAPGAYMVGDVAGESVIVVRQPDGTVRAMLNVCRHRGARILLDRHGTCGRTIRCPYHSWSYGLDGSLLGAPNMRGAIGDAQPRLGLQPVRVHEAHGCLWVNLDLDAPCFDEDIGAQLRARLGGDEALAGWELERLTSGHRIVYAVAANWKLIVENFMECYHCSSIHPELVSVVPEFRDGIASQALPVGHGSPLRDDADGFTVDGRAGLPALPGLQERERRSYYAITLMPNSFVNLFDDHVVLHRFTPVAVDRTEVVCEWLFAPEALAAHAAIEPTVALFDRVNRQDFEACERCQLGAASRVYEHDNVLVPVEHHLAAFHAEVRAALQDE
jgi:phenylpropionate dioxygenase-like ring-hydroxylating dioxygenase large terminal subunit